MAREGSADGVKTMVTVACCFNAPVFQSVVPCISKTVQRIEVNFCLVSQPQLWTTPRAALPHRLQRQQRDFSDQIWLLKGHRKNTVAVAA